MRRGFTLLEVLVALFMLSLSVLVLSSTVTLTSKVSRQSEARSFAMSIARHQMESILAVSQSNRALVTNQRFTIPNGLLAQFPGGASSMTGTYTVSFMPTSNNLQQITVVVKWLSQSSSATSSVTLSKIAGSVPNIAGSTFDGSTPPPDNILFYTPPPPPPPPPPGTTGGTTGGSTSSGSTGGTTGSSTDGSTSGTTGSSTSGSTGSTTGGSSSSGTTGGASTGGTSTGGSGGGFPGMSGSYGSKW